MNCFKVVVRNETDEETLLVAAEGPQAAQKTALEASSLQEARVDASEQIAPDSCRRFDLQPGQARRVEPGELP